MSRSSSRDRRCHSRAVFDFVLGPGALAAEAATWGVAIHQTAAVVAIGKMPLYLIDQVGAALLDVLSCPSRDGGRLGKSPQCGYISNFQ
jgi:hypothetical protein